MTRTSPTQRSLKWCRARNWLACVGEKWISQTKQRKDLFGFGDLLAVSDSLGAMLIQVTSADHASHRIDKIRGLPEAIRWLSAGNLIEVHGWRKNAKKRWVLNRWRLGLHQGEIEAIRCEDE